MHIFDEYTFKQRVERTYQNPLAAEPSWLCILHLVFANGLQLRASKLQVSASEAAILKRLSSDKLDRSEMFFLAAKHLKDSVSGFEDGDFASIQALLLMTLYMLSAAKRNTAWVYFGESLSFLRLGWPEVLIVVFRDGGSTGLCFGATQSRNTPYLQ